MLMCACWLVLVAVHGHCLQISATNLSSDTTWTIDDSPVEILPYYFLIDGGVRLTVEPGVTVRVYGNIYVEGEIKAIGTPEQPIVFDELYPDDGWSYLQFKRHNGVDLFTNEFQHVIITNMRNGISISEQSALFNNCTIDIHGSFNIALRSWVDRRKPFAYAAAETHMVSNHVTAVCTLSNQSSDVRCVLMNGCNSSFRDNYFCVKAEHVVEVVNGLQFYVANTTNFVADVTGNTIVAEAVDDSVLSACGIYYEDNEAAGTVSNNTISVLGPRELYGIRKGGEDVISHNTIFLQDTCDYRVADICGIETQSHAAETNDLVIDNTISIAAITPGAAVYGIRCYEGLIRGNCIRVTHSASSGNLYGIEQEYYSGNIENNTITVNSGTGLYARAVCIGTHYNTNSTVAVINNLIEGNGAVGSRGIVLGSVVQFTNSHNLVYNLDTPYQGCFAGQGALALPPGFSDNEGHISESSPAKGAGLYRWWMDDASDMEGQPRLEQGAVDIGADEYIYLPVSSGIVASNSDFTTSWSALPGAVYQLQYRTDFSTGSWINVNAPITASVATVVCADLGRQESRGYYRTIRMFALE